LKNKKFNLIFLFLLIINTILYIKLYTEYKTVFIEDKKLPIYSVDRKDKKIAITFDVNWGDNNIDQILDPYFNKITSNKFRNKESKA